jgi:hypothetical protein
MASAAVRARLEALKNDNAQPYHVGGGPAMYIGRPRIMLRDRSGNPTAAGQAWLDMGGADPARYQGAIQTHGEDEVCHGGRQAACPPEAGVGHHWARVAFDGEGQASLPGAE